MERGWYAHYTAISSPGHVVEKYSGEGTLFKKKIEITFDLVLNWWQHFLNSYGIRTIMITREIYQDEIIKPLELFQQRFHTNQDVDNFLTRIYHDKRNLIDIELPFMARHGDLWSANIVMQPQGIGVFDWESPLKRELPLFDLFFFFSSLRFPYRGVGGESEHLESFKSVFWGDNYFNKVICNRIQRMCEAFDVPLHVVGDLFLLSLIQTANMKYEGFMLAEGFRKEPNEGQQNNEDANNITQHLSRLEKDTPFACFRKGKFENILYVVQRGLPDFSNS